MITFNNKVVTYNNKWINESESPSPDIRHINIYDQVWSDDIKIDDGKGGVIIKEINGEQVYYYNFYAAYRIANSLSSEHWHLPSISEWQHLDSNIGRSIAMDKLKATTTWSTNNGTDDYGFSAKAYGMIDYPGHSSGTYPNVIEIGNHVYYWSSSAMNTQPYSPEFSNTGVIEWAVLGGDTMNMFHLLRLIRY